MTKKSKCLKLIEQLRLAPQMKCEIVSVSSIFILFLIGIITLKIYLNNLNLYKNIYNIIEHSEFNELNYIELLIENDKIQLENSFKNELLFLTNYYKNLEHFDLQFLEQNEINNLNNLKTNKFYNELNYYCFKETSCLNLNNFLINEKFESIFKNIGIYLKYLFFNNKSFHNKPNQNLNILFKKFFFIDFSKEIMIIYNDIQTNYKSNIKLKNIKTYIINKLKNNYNNIILFNKILPNNILPFENIFQLPIFDLNKENFSIFLDDSSSSNEDSMIEYLSFCVIPSKIQQNYVNLTENNLSEYIDKAFFIFGKENPNKIIYDPIILSTPTITILNSDYLFPYKLFSKEYCYIVRTINLSKFIIKKLGVFDDLSNIIYLAQCFDSEKTIHEFSNKFKKVTILNEFFDNFKLFYKTDFLEDSIKDRELETNLIFDNKTVFNQTIDSIIYLNKKQYKIKKTYSPLNIQYILTYFYPFSDVSLNFLIKDEGFSKYISNELKTLIKASIINSLIIVFLIIIILIIVLKIILSFFTKKISNQVNKLNDTFFITGQSTQEENLEKKNKESSIDEFKELIQIISEMVKGDINLKQIHNIKDENNYKLQIDEFNIEFEKNKIYNILVNEDEIENILEKGNYTSKILKQNINDIKKDNFIIKSSVYSEQIKKIEDLEEYEKKIDKNKNNLNNNIDNFSSVKKNDLIFYKNNFENIFNDKETLQNTNNILYYNFKEKYDKIWYKKYKKEIEEKNKEIKSKK